MTRGDGMVKQLEDNREAIVGLCTRYGVARLDVFGSALRGDFRAGQSDLDLLIEFIPMSPYERADSYFGFLDDLRSLVGMEVDLVVSGAIKNRFVSEEIERSKQVFYAA
jgi:predicted nucleotidyltransferase